MNLRYLLSSNFPLPGNEAIAECLRSNGVDGAIAWMAPRPDPERFAQAKAQFARLGFDTLVDVSDGGAQELAHAEPAALYLSGGDPILFRDRLRATGIHEWITRNASSPQPIPIVGASGGAMQLSANVSIVRLLSVDLPTVLRERNSYHGLALADLEVVPHFQSQPAHRRAVLAEYAASARVEVWGLEDGAGLVCSDDGIAAIGNAIRVQGYRGA